MERLLPLLLLLLCPADLWAQTSDPNTIVGRWVLVRYLMPDGKAPPKEALKGFYEEYRFLADGTYTVRGFSPGNDTCVTTGQWTMSANGHAIQTTANNMLPPYDKAGTISDHIYPVVKLDGSHLALKEYLFTEAAPGTSYFERR